VTSAEIEAAAIGVHLADQLLLPMALAGGGSFTTLLLSPHAATNMDVIKKFLDVEIKTTALADSVCKVELSA
jgi:RNA 3'-terminal phosphate cyclase (ATP)